MGLSRTTVNLGWAMHEMGVLNGETVLRCCGGGDPWVAGTLRCFIYAVQQAKKRQTIEKRLQDKLRKETDSVRRAEEAKKDKTSANRKEEELQLKDSIVRPFSIFKGVRVYCYVAMLTRGHIAQTTSDTTTSPSKLPSHIRCHPPC